MWKNISVFFEVITYQFLGRKNYKERKSRTLQYHPNKQWWRWHTNKELMLLESLSCAIETDGKASR